MRIQDIVIRFVVKMKLVTLFEGKFLKEVLEKSFHCRRISMAQKLRKGQVETNQSVSFVKGFDFWSNHYPWKKNSKKRE